MFIHNHFFLVFNDWFLKWNIITKLDFDNNNVSITMSRLWTVSKLYQKGVSEETISFHRGPFKNNKLLSSESLQMITDG